MRAAVLTLTAGALCAGLLAPAAQAAPAVRYVDYANCTAMNKVYPHGVGKKGAHDHTSGKPVTNFYRNTRLYKINASHDGDHDGIACEKD